MALALYTGWLERAYFSERYYQENPYLSPEAAGWLVEQRLAAVAVDFRGPRRWAAPARGYARHRTLLRAGVLLYENLVHLEQLPPAGFTLYAFPLKVRDGNGAPARIVAWVV